MAKEHEFQAHSTRIWIFLNSQLFFCRFGFRPHVCGEYGMQIHNFSIPLSRVERFQYANNFESCGSNQDIFKSDDVTNQEHHG